MYSQLSPCQHPVLLWSPWGYSPGQNYKQMYENDSLNLQTPAIYGAKLIPCYEKLLLIGWLTTLLNWSIIL